MRWEQGRHNAVALHRELQERGYQRKYNAVRGFVLPLRARRIEQQGAEHADAERACRRPVTDYHPDRVNDDERLRLKQIMKHCPELSAAHRLVRDFAAMLTGGTATTLPGWDR